MANPKVIAVRVPKISIEAVRNGYRVTVGSNAIRRPGYISFSQPSDPTSWSDTVVTTTGVWTFADTKKPKPAPTYITPSGEYVFPGFASLTAWLRKNITHGNGVEP